MTILIFCHLSSEDAHTLWLHSTAVLSCVLPNLCRSVWQSRDYFVVLTCPNWGREWAREGQRLPWERTWAAALATRPASLSTVAKPCCGTAVGRKPLSPTLYTLEAVYELSWGGRAHTHWGLVKLLEIPPFLVEVHDQDQGAAMGQ